MDVQIAVGDALADAITRGEALKGRKVALTRTGQPIFIANDRLSAAAFKREGATYSRRWITRGGHQVAGWAFL